MLFFGRFGVAAICGVVVLVIMDVLLVGNLSADARIWYTALVRVTLYGVAAIAAPVQNRPHTQLRRLAPLRDQRRTGA